MYCDYYTIEILEGEKQKLKDAALLPASLISKLVEHLQLTQEPSGQLLQAIWRTLDAIYHQGVGEDVDLSVGFLSVSCV